MAAFGMHVVVAWRLVFAFGTRLAVVALVAAPLVAPLALWSSSTFVAGVHSVAAVMNYSAP